MGTKWNEPLSFTISFMKDVCSEPSQRNLVFTEEEVNAINTWLTSPDYPTLFHMYDYDFERDSLNNMILIDYPEDAASFTVVAEGYPEVTYEINGNVCHMIYDESSALMKPPKPRVERFDGYFSLQFYEDKFPSKVISITCDDIEYSNISTDDWLSMYEAAKIQNVTSESWMQMYPVGSLNPYFYTILLNKVKVLNVKYDYFGLFTEIVPQEVGGEVIGFTATFTANSPFAWTHEITQHIDAEEAAGEYSFSVNTAEKYREINPIFQIHVPESSEETEDGRSLIVLSSMNDKYAIRMNLMQGATTTIDCDKCQIYYILDSDVLKRKRYDSIDDIGWVSTKINDAYISQDTLFLNIGNADSPTPEIEFDSLDDINWGHVAIKSAHFDDNNTLYLTLVEPRDDEEEHDLIETGLEDTKLIHWPRLYYGLNTFHFSSGCSCSIIYREPRKVGDW